MPKRRAVIKRIAGAARRQGVPWTYVREGANHSVFSLDGLMIPIPRHNEIERQLAEIIFRECAPKLGKGWWR